VREILFLIFLAAGLGGCMDPPQAPPTPSLQVAVIEQIDAYARLLRETGRMDRAGEIAAQVEVLHESVQARLEAQQAFEEGRPYETSFYLGFDPRQTLQEYAAELRRMGRTSEAEEMEALATRYREDQERAAEELIRQYRQQQ
jgi:hypothetical protein